MQTAVVSQAEEGAISYVLRAVWLLVRSRGRATLLTAQQINRRRRDQLGRLHSPKLHISTPPLPHI